VISAGSRRRRPVPPPAHHGCRQPGLRALHGFARRADDIVDTTPPGTGRDQVAAGLTQLAAGLFTGLRNGHGDDPVLAAPVVPARPPVRTSVASVTTLVGGCEPADIVANRLDPWHGSWFHPYSFSRLSMLSAPGEADVMEEEDRFLVSVTFRVAPGLGVPVRAEFSCPGPRTVVMRITDGEGAGSVVETHATPRGRGADARPRTAVVEAVIAESGRPGFAFAGAAAPVLRRVMRRAAARLWRDDLAYAERRYQLRSM
jgi:Domain of unknown function (DUF5914)